MGCFISSLSSTVCLSLQPKNGTEKTTNITAMLGHQTSRQISDFVSAVLAFRRNTCRAPAFPASVSLCGWDCSLEPAKRWGGCGLGGSLAWLSSSVVTASFLFTGGAVEDSGEAGVLLWVFGWVECLHYPPGVAGPSPSLWWCWGRAAQTCLWNPAWAFAWAVDTYTCTFFPLSLIK